MSEQTPATRAAALLAEMTLEEKAQQLTAVMPHGLLSVGAPSKQQLDAELSIGIGHVSMFSMFGHLLPAELARAVNSIQRYLVEETRLGIPAMFHIEALNGLVAPGFTAFPTAIALAATWDPKAVEAMAGVLARQLRAVGHGQALSPVMDVARDARWGRVHETYGEDPHLVSAMSVAFTRGLQGDDLGSGAIATGKHFLGFGMSEGGQHMAATAVSGRELREVYARPFEAAIMDAGLASIMNSYATIDGVPVGANRRILTELLRDELGFTGAVVSDYGTIANFVDRQGVATDLEEAARLALEAGLDVELPSAKAYGSNLVEAVRKGSISEALVDRSVLRVLHDKFALGLFDSPFVPEDRETIEVIAHDGAGLATDLARRSVTVLRNDGDVLPVARATRRIAVIGPHADRLDTAFPGYTYYAGLAMIAAASAGEESNLVGADAADSQLSPAAAEVLSAQLAPALADGLDAYIRKQYGAKSLADAIRSLSTDTVVVSAQGCGVLDDEPADIDVALEAASGADVVILALGGRPGWFGARLTEGEGSDRADIALPARQVALAAAVAAVGRPTVGVIFTGRPFALDALDDVLPALVHAPYGGQHGMDAVAEVLLGVVEPSGRLPISIPRHSGQIPVHHGQHLGSGYRRTAADVHRSYNDLSSRPRYPFGHGLSYTRFEYSELAVRHGQIPTDGTLTAEVTVTNVGSRAGTEVVQFYASHRAPLVTRPAQGLVGFQRVDLEPGSSRTVEISVSTGQLAYLGADSTFVFDSGELELAVGSSSDDIRSRRSIAVVGPRADWSKGRPFFAMLSIR